MIIGLWHPGSGVGDQLFCYLATRIRAEELGVEFGMVGDFKGDSFMKLDRGSQVDLPFLIEEPAGKIVIQADLPLFEGQRWYDPEYNFVEDNTIIDGCMMQDIRYFGDKLRDISAWLNVERIEIPDDTCVIWFRGGEYSVFPQLFLPKAYWDKGIEIMKERGITKFEVHTDDPERAKQFFPDYECIHDVGINWRSVRFAKNAIIANSAFYILPRLLGGGFTIAPRYWARRNTQVWALPSNFYKQFFYI